MFGYKFYSNPENLTASRRVWMVTFSKSAWCVGSLVDWTNTKPGLVLFAVNMLKIQQSWNQV